MHPKKWPVTVKVGSVGIKVYRVKNRGRWLFSVAHYIGTQRKLKQFGDFTEARKEAGRLAALLSAGEKEVLRLTGADAQSFVEAKRILGPFNVPLLSAVEEWVEARKLGFPVLTAARDYAKRHQTITSKKTVAETVDLFIKAKETDGMSVRYIADCRSRLGRFARDVVMDISAVDTSILTAWLRGLGQSGRSRNNYRGMVQSLFRHARAEGFLPKGVPTAADDLPLAKDRGGEIGIFKPDALAALLNAKPKELKVKGDRKQLVPYVVLGALAGLRHAEVCRMTWSDIDLPQRIVRVGSDKSKTAQNRLVPLGDAAVAWLSPYADSKGQICSDRQSKYARNVARKLGLEWPANGLKHSFGSNRLAEVKSAPQVALEMGNTPAMIFNHYRALVTESDAAAWFSIFPPSYKNNVVVPFKKEAGQ